MTTYDDAPVAAERSIHGAPFVLLALGLMLGCGSGTAPTTVADAAADGPGPAPTDAGVDTTPDVDVEPLPDASDFDVEPKDAAPAWPPCLGPFPKACSVPTWDVISPNLWQNKGLVQVGCGSLWMKTIGISQDGVSTFPMGLMGVRLGPVAIGQKLGGDFSLAVTFRGLETNFQGKATYAGASFVVWVGDSASASLAAGIIRDVFAIPFSGWLKFVGGGYQPLAQNALPKGTVRAARVGNSLTLAFDPNDGSGPVTQTITVAAGPLDVRFILTSPDNQNGKPNPTVETSVEVTGVQGTGAAANDTFACNSLK